MSRNSERPLAPHVQTAIGVGQGVGQAKMGGQEGGRVASHVQAAIAAGQAKMAQAPTVALVAAGHVSDWEVATHVRRPAASATQGNVRPVSYREQTGHVQQAVPSATQPKLGAEDERAMTQPVVASASAARRAKILLPASMAEVGGSLRRLPQQPTPARSVATRNSQTLQPMKNTPTFSFDAGAKSSFKARVLENKAKYGSYKLMSELVERGYDRPMFHCCQCHHWVTEEAVHGDHVVGQAQGGGNEIENLRILCVGCNTANLHNKGPVASHTRFNFKTKGNQRKYFTMDED